MAVDPADAQALRVGILGRRVDQALPDPLPTNWSAAGANANILHPDMRQIIIQALNDLYENQGGIDTLTNSLIGRLNASVGVHAGADAVAFNAIGKNLIQAVYDLIQAGPGGGGGVPEPTDDGKLYGRTRANGVALGTWEEIVAGGPGGVSPSDVAAAISTHNTDTNAHNDIRTTLAGKADTSTVTTDIATAVSTHNASSTSHSDIRTALDGKTSEVDVAADIAAHSTDASAHSDIRTALDAKQGTLISGTNIRTVNNQTLLGSGNLSIAGAAGGVEAVRSNLMPFFYRPATVTAGTPNNPLGAYMALGATPFVANGYHMAILTNEPSQLWYYNPGGGYGMSPSATAYTKQSSPVNLASVGYVGQWAVDLSGPFMPGIHALCMPRTGSAALSIRTSGPNWTSGLIVESKTLQGLPSGFDTVAMWASSSMILVVVNGLLYQCRNMNWYYQSQWQNAQTFLPPEPSFLFTQVTAPAINAVTTKTRLVAADGPVRFGTGVTIPPGTFPGQPTPTVPSRPEDSWESVVSLINAYRWTRYILWGTAPNNNAVFYDEQTDQYINLTLPFAHNGAANCIVIFPTTLAGPENCKVGAYDPATGNYYTCFPMLDPTAWTLRYQTTTNRRMVLIGWATNVCPCFLPSGMTTSSFTAESYPDVGTESTTVYAGGSRSGSSHAFPTDYLCEPQRTIIPGTTTATGFCFITGNRRTWASVFGDQQTFLANTQLTWPRTVVSGSPQQDPTLMPTITLMTPNHVLGPSSGRVVQTFEHANIGRVMTTSVANPT